MSIVLPVIPPRPEIALRVGVTGHRPDQPGATPPRFPLSAVPAVEAKVSAALAAIAGETRRLEGLAEYRAAYRVDPHRPAGLRLLSALAEGADRIVAERALAAGYALEVVLPMQPDEYERDFRSAHSRAGFRDLLARAAVVFDLALPGAGSERQRAYEAAGHVILDNCDLLVAVWNAGPSGGRGGTADIVADARGRGIPVIHVDPLGGGRALLQGQASRPAPDEAIAHVVRAILAPPSDPGALSRYYREGETDGVASDAARLDWWRFAPWFLGLARRAARHEGEGGGPEPRAQAPFSGGAGVAACATAMPDTENRAALLQAFHAADAISTRLGHVYRSAYVLLFLLSALAVMVGLASVFVWDEATWKSGFVGLELLLILLMWRIASQGAAKNRAWHERWLATRRLAELLRVAAALAPVGGGSRIAREPEEKTRSEGAWTEWYLRARLRETALPRASADRRFLEAVAAGFLAGTVRDQIDYHEKTASRLRQQHDGLDRIGMVLFASTVVVGVVYVVAALALRAGGITGGWAVFMFVAFFKPLVTMSMAGLPALGAALYGIRALGDFETTASRSMETAAELRVIAGRIETMLSTPDLPLMRSLFTRAAEIMLSDLSDWRWLYRHRPIVLPT